VQNEATCLDLMKVRHHFDIEELDLPQLFELPDGIYHLQAALFLFARQI